MDTAKLKELRGQKKEKREKLRSIFDEAGESMDMSAVKQLDGDSAAKAAEIKRINTELEDIATQAEPLEQEYAVLEKGKREAELVDEGDGHPIDRGGKGRSGPEETKGLGDLIVAAADGSPIDLKGREIEVPDFDIKAAKKALFETGSGWEPEITRTGRLVPFATRPVQFIDILPLGETSQQGVRFMQETVFENKAAAVPEGGKKPEAKLKLAPTTAPVEKIAVWLPVTDEQLEDVPQVQGYLNNRLPFMVRLELDRELVEGTGAPQLQGFLNTPGIQEQAKGGDPTPDAIYKAGTKVETIGQGQRGPVVMNPADWQEIRLLRTEDGIYIWGSPAEAGPEMIWGQRVIKVQAMAEGTALTGDFAQFSEFALRSGMTVKVSDSHAEFFIENKQAIRAEMRGALVIYRPTAFVKVTGV